MGRCDTFRAVLPARIVRSHGWCHGARGGSRNEPMLSAVRLFSAAWPCSPRFSSDAVAAARHKQVEHAGKADAGVGHHQRNAALKKGKTCRSCCPRRGAKPAPSTDKPVQTATVSPLSGDLAAVKQAIDLMRKAKIGEATAVEKNHRRSGGSENSSNGFILRHADSEASFGRYAAFIADNPKLAGHGPAAPARAEARLWQDRSDAATVRRFAAGQPATRQRPVGVSRGFCLPRVTAAGAHSQVSEAWRSEELSERV